MRKYAFGIDLGGTSVKLGFFQTDGTLLEKWEIPTRTENNGSAILPDISNAVLSKLAERNIVKEEVEGIGIGVPGPIDPQGNVLGCVNLGWGVFSVEEALGHLSGMKVKAGNDANVAALGETWKGGGKGFQDIVMVTIGTGVGGGIIIGGKIIPGVNGAAGEIGHISMRDDEQESCGCGNHGCLEQYASARGFAHMTQKYLDEHPDFNTSLRGTQKLTSKVIFDEAKKGDTVALDMVEEAGRLLGKAMAGIACVVNPEAFVIGGGMSKAGPILTDVIRKYFRKYAFHAEKETALKLAELGNDAGIYGSVKMLLS